MTQADEKLVKQHVLRQHLKGVAVGLILAGVALILVGQVVANKFRIEDNQRELENLKQSQTDQTATILAQTDLIQQQGVRIENLSQTVLCYLQLSTGDNFTNREECQQRVREARSQVGVGMGGVGSQQSFSNSSTTNNFSTTDPVGRSIVEVLDAAGNLIGIPNE